MRSRKPVSSGHKSTNIQQDYNNPPYLLSPEASDHPTHDVASLESQTESPWRQDEQIHPQRTVPSIADMDDGWADGDMKEDELGKKPLINSKVGEEMAGGWGEKDHEIPASLRVGPLEDTPRTSSESQRSREEIRSQAGNTNFVRQASPHATTSTNPYLRASSAERLIRPPSVPQSQEESSVDIWADMAFLPPPTQLPPQPPSQAFFEEMRNLSLAAKDSHDLSAPLDPIPYSTSSSSGKAPQTSGLIKQANYEDAHPSPFHMDPFGGSADLSLAQKGWTVRDHSNRPLSSMDAKRRASDVGDTSPMRRNTRGKELSGIAPNPLGETPPQLPLRRTSVKDENTPFQPPQSQPRTHPDPNLSISSRSDSENLEAVTAKQRSETYQIKHIRWIDSSRSNELRTSPIMVQNANGPCPLLALVNALTLSTPANITTPLVETLRVREQVTLGLLLDAVFDELMSGRRGDAAQELPDVSDLYTFLVTLHTGMNVNPLFIAAALQPNLMDSVETDAPISVIDVEKPGGFEETKEMKLYSAFSMPLIHGWLPAPSHPAFNALRRSARSYEDAQNLMFREEELEDKIHREGLNGDEQLLLEDIASVKYFLSWSATQLTSYGIEKISDNLPAGSLAILFRNDHFSTLYKHPQSGQLLTLVTDLGYAGHAEVVWESLVDVSGEGSVFFAGDFRPVGQSGNNHVGQDDDQSWTTVARSGRKNTSTQPSMPSQPQPRLASSDSSEDYNLPVSSHTEQQDADLALAMQLQEEEEDRSRRETEARRRNEDQLSQQYLESQQGPPLPRRNTASNSQRGGIRSQVVRPLVPPRGGSAVASTSSRPPAQQADPEAGEDAPPPSYEQAAKLSPYIPAAEHSLYQTPQNSGASTGIRPSGSRPRATSAYNQQHAEGTFDQRRGNSSRMSFPNRGGLGHLGVSQGGIPRRSGGLSEEERREKDCIIM